MDIYIQWAGFLLAPITGIVSWIAGSRSRKADEDIKLNEALNKVQATCDLLIQRNHDLTMELINVRSELAEANKQVDALKSLLDQIMNNQK